MRVVKNRVRSAAAIAALGLLSACGGGGTSAGVNSTPPPGPTPTPTPTPPPPPTPQDLVTLDRQTSFTAQAARLDVRVAEHNGRLIGNAQSVAERAITVVYNPAAGTYALTSPSRTSFFTPTDAPDGNAAEPIIVFSKTGPDTQDGLILVRPGTDTPPEERHVGLGLWQTVKPSPTRDSVIVDFDTFFYGFPTPAASVPRVGSAQFEVLLIGLETTSFDAPPYNVQGYGLFDVDFQRGAFRTSGEAYLTSIFDGTAGTSQQWTGSGTLSSSNGDFSGRFSISYPSVWDGSMVGSLNGSFFGPGAPQLGATVVATNPFSTFGGALIGFKGDREPAMPFTILPRSGDSAFATRYSVFSHILDDTAKILTGAPYHSRPLQGGNTIITDPAVLNANAGLVELLADMSVAFSRGTLDPGVPWPGFTGADASAALSTGEFSAYEKAGAQGTDRLYLFRPGSQNSALQLTYASFGEWRSVNPSPGQTKTTSTTFVFGVPTLADMLPRMGVGRYAGIMRGSGVGRAGGGRYALSGNAAFEINFEGRGVSGLFEPVATPVGDAPALALEALHVSGAVDRDYSFKGAIWSSPGPYEAGSWSGQLYGPAGEEAAGLLDFVAHDADRNILADFSGAFVARKTP